MNKQVFSRTCKQVTSVTGALVVVVALVRFIQAQTGVSLLALVSFTLLAVFINSRFTIPVPRERWRLSPNESLLLLAALLFGGEAAVLMAVVTALCLALRSGRHWLNLSYATAATVISTALFVLFAHQSVGSIAALNSTGSLTDYALLCAIVVPLHAAARFITAGLATGFFIVEKDWRGWLKISLHALLVSVVGAGAACLSARLIGFVGLGVFTYLAPVAVICGVAWDAFRQNNYLYFGVINDRAGATTETNESEERFRHAFDYAAIGMALVSTEGRWLQVNRSLCRLLDYTEKELQTTDLLTVIHHDDVGSVFEHIKRLVKGSLPVIQIELRLRHKHGREVWVLASVSLAGHSQSQPHLIFQMQDITDRKLAEERLQHDAFHDALTGLPNRTMFLDHLRLAIARSQRRDGTGFAVLYLDVDRFKVINDSLGHTVGDQLLIGLARRLEACLRLGDTVARLGGDEFILLVEDLHDEAEAITVAERIQGLLQQPFELNGREFFATVSIGIASSWTSYQNAEDIVRDADTAMYRAKSSGKARHEIFDGAMHAQANKVLQLETDLRHALERNEFAVHYQPIVALQDFRLRGFEALVRWQHPERGFISPVDFIPIAEESGLIIQLGEWVLREACTQMERWQKIFPAEPPLYVAVNLSGKQFIQQDLIKQVSDILMETEIDPHGLKLEITESMVMDNVEQATEMLKQLRALGLKLSIDDFGTGYSSLSYLHRFPVNTLKIDRSFVTRMSDNNENREIVRTIVTLAQTLGMDVVAEGVETNEQLAMLCHLGCECGQGYFFSKPVDAKGAEKIICETYVVGNASQPAHQTRYITPRIVAA
jgi:diguanylate cyclase (GGDEF)-like protein/PAS domain S-box-containing protein